MGGEGEGGGSTFKRPSETLGFAFVKRKKALDVYIFLESPKKQMRQVKYAFFSLAELEGGHLPSLD